MDTLVYAIKVNPGKPDSPCHISELVKGDHFYWVSDGRRSDLNIASSDPYRNAANSGEEQWSVDSEKVN